MTKDLEETLAGLGPEHRAVVGRLRAARELEPVRLRRRSRIAASAYLVAASALAVFGVAAVLSRAPRWRAAPTQGVYVGVVNEYALARIATDAALKEIVRTQNADGSWKNDFLTRQNAKALSLCHDPAAQIAYRKAARNLRMRGLH